MKNVKKYVIISAAVIVLMVILLLLLSIGEMTNIKKTFNMIVIIATVVTLLIVWLKYYNDMKSVMLGETEDVAAVTAHTGTQCEIEGLYQCTEHENRQINMKVGKRFPPCKGDTKGHSCDWVLIKKE